ncbi:UBA domain-containing protein [Verticillium dahliae VdLs.17]|uniref:UBA domain-containing protein n=1 Tax=Verticillium dahliae (strain VdLs.17 / ATCC MYA-4575 / FGSC 10137) TaxID=498257 RepID=G2XGX5_VERDV|nr:UBA domain-containing protein [Verticillium dahliae VdLs.17]EGY19073.1 UBA domain-containing protein [Verticillium dahliae VdLs.17]
MDDLSGLDWSASSTKQQPKAPSIPPGANYYGSAQLNPSPSPFQSGRNTPLSTTQSKPSTPPVIGGGQTKPPAAPADSFSNLLNFGGPAKPNANLSLRERQERLEAEKRQKAEERRKQAETSFGSGQFWDTLGNSSAASRTASPALAPPSRAPATSSGNGVGTSADDDLFAAFNKDTKVDNASHYPPPAPKPVSPALDLSDPTAWNKAPAASTSNVDFDDDDDPFGLNTMKGKAPAAVPAASINTADDDDFLGDLAKPVEEVRRKHTPQPKQPEAGKPIEGFDSSSDDEAPVQPRRRGKGQSDEFDDAVAQLVGYGFTPENARRGLTESGAGLNVQAAANWLLDDAHRLSKAKAQGKDPLAESRRHRDVGRADGPRRTDSRSPAAGDDLSKAAAAVGSSVFKAANSFWKTSKKQVAQAYAEFNQPEGDPSQPKWMRSAQQEQGAPAPSRQAAEATDEAMMLDSGARPERRPAQRPQAPRPDERKASPRGPSPALSAGPSSGRNSPAPRWQQSAPVIPDSRARASKLAMEDDSLSSYVSPHRRKKATPQPQPQSQPAAPQEEPDLPQAAQPVKRPTPAAAPRATASARRIPPISPAAVAQSAQHRLAGTQHFKRGDYASAHASYSSSLAAVPSTHPLAIVILTNRALTSLKNGEPKKAVEDADAALQVIGPSQGQGEHVSVTTDAGAEERRDMRDLYAKALSRKAEALEQMERWAEAGAVWQTCVQGGIGGPTAVAGRQRCQAALAPKAKPKPKPKAAPARAPVRPRAAATQQKSSEAVERLRQQNVAAAAEDDEKFALSEKVDARVAAWRDGKRDNLRALLGSLDAVLWEGSGWKKVGLHELVMANKVKIAYMKAIAKCHPDKLAQDASTEVRLIAATVFATLNESWDKFKSENGL